MQIASVCVCVCVCVFGSLVLALIDPEAGGLAITRAGQMFMDERATSKIKFPVKSSQSMREH